MLVETHNLAAPVWISPDHLAWKFLFLDGDWAPRFQMMASRLVARSREFALERLKNPAFLFRPGGFQDADIQHLISQRHVVAASPQIIP
ncbi:hypothetical protein L810_6990 [Burkholderia sp. AU4i]|nr:hypothetical protein L810_6990 [Burkholderia sp. AU4i]